MNSLLFICFLSAASLAQGYTLPCRAQLYNWALLTNTNKSVGMITTVNPFTLQTLDQFTFKNLDLSILSTYDSDESQFAVGSSAKNTISLLSVPDGDATSISYDPSTISLTGSVASTLQQEDSLISLGGTVSSAICQLTPVIRVDLSSGQATVIGCVSTDNFQTQVISLDETQNILYYATLHYFYAVDLNTSLPLYKVILPQVTNIYVGSNTIWVTIGSWLGTIVNQKFIAAVDLSKILGPGTTQKGATFDTKGEILNGAFGYPGQNPTFFMLALDNFSLISKYQPTNNNFLYTSRIGWFCNTEK